LLFLHFSENYLSYLRKFLGRFNPDATTYHPNPVGDCGKIVLTIKWKIVEKQIVGILPAGFCIIRVEKILEEPDEKHPVSQKSPTCITFFSYSSAFILIAQYNCKLLCE
jgi:hypothetical protein